MSEATQVPEEKKEDRNPLLDKALKEKENWRSKAQELEQKFQEQEKQKLEEQQKFKELSEIYKTKSEQLEMKIKEAEEREVKATKLNALKSELSKMGIKQDKFELAFKLAPIDQLKYDADNRLVLGADEVAKALKDQTPEWFGTTGVKVDQSAPASNPVKLNAEQWKTMSAEERSKVSLKDAYKAFGIDAR